jgi:hypothetical protein
MIQKIHSSILNIHDIVGEKEAATWLTQKERKTVTTVKLTSSPKRRNPKRVSKILRSPIRGEGLGLKEQNVF